MQVVESHEHGVSDVGKSIPILQIQLLCSTGVTLDKGLAELVFVVACGGLVFNEQTVLFDTFIGLMEARRGV